jgi:hypothetical protein
MYNETVMLFYFEPKPGIRWIAILVGAFFLIAGCGKNDIQTYRIIREADSALPPGWEEQPADQMRFASFRVHGPENQKAEVSVVPLPGSAGNDLANVNRWLEQLGMAPVSESDLSGLSQTVKVGGSEARLYDLVATAQSNTGTRERILAAVTHRDEAMWFFKMKGDERLVEAQKPAFITYLSQFKFPEAIGTAAGAKPTDAPPSRQTAAPQASGASGAEPSALGSKASLPQWKVPEDWKETEPGAMLTAKYLVGSGDSQAAVNIMQLGGEGGGLAVNVNRWRGQIGLEPTSPEEIAKIAKPLTVTEGTARIIEMDGPGASGQPMKIIGVLVTLPGSTWFYKMMGAPAAVSAQKDNLVKFVQSAKYRS